MVQAVDVLGNEGADRTGVLQSSKRVVRWVWEVRQTGKKPMYGRGLVNRVTCTGVRSQQYIYIWCTYQYRGLEAML
jgi:hypothetical protein